jgi:OOP family OmpA-OmpF porin
MKLLIFILLSSALYSQNLVKNASFEYVNQCSKTNNNIQDCKYVYRGYYDNTPEYFNECNNVSGKFQTTGVPLNFFGNQVPKTGKGYFGVTINFIENHYGKYREFIIVEFSEKLVQGKSYDVSCYLSLADNSNFYVDKFSFCFKKDTLAQNVNNLNALMVSCSNDYIYENKEGFKSKDEWQKIQFRFKADGGEKYLLIGFTKKTFTSSDVKKILKNRIAENLPLNEFDCAYYYIDDVEVFEVK